MSAGGHQEGLQVVKLGDGELRYQVDEEALKRVLLRADVRDLPVVVVSVAGAYRGGKSFILDFFLRYLNASRSDQLSGKWLGEEDQPLVGFHWRGGGERDTTGIHLWPYPVITTLERTGEKVAVFLMDTQGTFDSESTIGDNSTIFALSTLISSVQVYNISGNIREDDLQHLQLFTEYGKLASNMDGNGKAFQTLNFLVRDWMSEYEHPLGYQGGEGLLNKRLQSKANQKQELREVREHIRSCFDDIKCFLMPHPGLNVANQNFNGCLSAVTEKFRLALLELVPSLFDTSQLTVKLINGEKVKARDLLEYFMKYVNIFNSDEIPQAVTIFKATAEACMSATVRASHDKYEALMNHYINEHISVPSTTLDGWHQDATNKALQLYEEKKKLGTTEDIAYHFQQLTKELNARLPLYKWNNEAKVRESLAIAKKVYEDAVQKVCEVQAQLCLHPLDLIDLHKDSKTSALERFDSTRFVPETEEDKERSALATSLEEQYKHLSALNEQNNRSGVLAARDAYVESVRARLNAAGAVGSAALRELHAAALEPARRVLLARRCSPTQRAHDPYLQQLDEEIETCFNEFSKMNVNNNKIAMQVAEYTYNNLMSSAWGPQACCFHPQALQKLHKKSLEETIQKFLSNRDQNSEDDYKDNLLKVLGNRYDELKNINDFNNRQAVDHAFGVYTRKMDRHSQPSVVSILIVPFIVKVLARLPEYNKKAKRDARDEFYVRRRGDSYDDDEYIDMLNKKMDAAFQEYRNPFLALLRELGIPTEK